MPDCLGGQRNDPRLCRPPVGHRSAGAIPRNRSPEVQAQVWEIVWLHSHCLAHGSVLSCIPTNAGTSTATTLDIRISALRRELERVQYLAEERRRREAEE